MFDFLKDNKDGSPNKNANIFLDALLRGFGNLFGKVFADNQNGKPTLFSFIPKIFGQMFQMVKSFMHSILDHKKEEPVIKEVLSAIDRTCDGGTKATQNGLSNLVTGIIQQSPYKEVVNKNDDLLTMFVNSVINSNTKNTNSSSATKSQPSKPTR